AEDHHHEEDEPGTGLHTALEPRNTERVRRVSARLADVPTAAAHCRGPTPPRPSDLTPSPSERRTFVAFDLMKERGIPLEKQKFTWKDMVRAPYSKLDVDAFTRVRVIFMNGIESEQL